MRTHIVPARYDKPHLWSSSECWMVKAMLVILLLKIDFFLAFKIRKYALQRYFFKVLDFNGEKHTRVYKKFLDEFCAFFFCPSSVSIKCVLQIWKHIDKTKKSVRDRKGFKNSVFSEEKHRKNWQINGCDQVIQCFSSNLLRHLENTATVP